MRPRFPSLAALSLLFLFVVSASFAGLEHKISLDFRDADIRDIIKLIATKSGFNIVAEKSVRGNVTIRLTDITCARALDLVCEGNGFAWTLQKGAILVSDEKKLPVLTRSVHMKNTPAIEMFKIVAQAVKKDCRGAVHEDLNSVIFTARASTIREVERIVRDNDLPRRYIDGTIVIAQGKDKSAARFKTGLGDEVYFSNGSTVLYPGGADQPPKEMETGIRATLRTILINKDGDLEGELKVESSFVQAFSNNGMYPIKGGQKFNSSFKAARGKSTRIFQFVREGLPFTVTLSWK